MRKVFSSFADHALILHLTASSSGAPHVSVSLDAKLRRLISVTDEAIQLTGKASARFTATNHPGGAHPLQFSDVPGEGMAYALRLRVLTGTGKVKASASSIDFVNADAAHFTSPRPPDFAASRSLRHSVEQVHATAARRV